MNVQRTLVAAMVLAAVTNASADWTFTAVPNQSVHEGDGARMFVGPGGSLHFLLTTFYYASTGDINYHALVDGNWIDERLWGEYGGIYVSPAFDPDGHLHFLHSRGWISAGYQLRLASRDAGDWTGWTHTAVAPAGEFPSPSSLAIDALGTFHAAYVETENGDLTYATFDGTAWAFEQTGEGPDASKAVFVGLSAAGNPHITYINGSGDLQWIQRVSGQWSVRTLYTANLPSDIAAISALTDSAGRPHVAYTLRGSAFTVRYTHQTSSGWVNEVVPVTPTWGGLSLALDAAGHPGICYNVGAPPLTTNVRYAKSDGAAWNDQVVTSDGASRLVALAFLPSSEPVIAIQRGSYNTVMYASPPSCSPSIGAQPSDSTTCPSGTATFSVAAAGTGTLTYQWQWQPAGAGTEWVNLTAGDNAEVGGEPVMNAANVGTATLQARPLAGYINLAPRALRCIITSACGSVTSNPATLIFCAADFNCSGAIAVNDIFEFLAEWFAGTPTADFNSLGGITVQDIFDFLAAWFAGCA